MKTCSKPECKQVNPQPLDNFFNDKNNKTDGKYPVCKACKRLDVYAWRNKNKAKYNASAREWGKNNQEKRYGSEIKRRYGCTLERYNEMLIAQGCKCAICPKLHNPADKKGRLFVDHCHKSGEVRALLCSACNSMLGYANDDTDIIQKAIDYIIKYRKA